jgi:secreted Zn-dependent insulinase-like peptidase
MVMKKFVTIPKKNAKRYEPNDKELALTPDRLPARLNVVPLNDTHRLILIFPVPSAKKFFKVGPLYYIAALLQNHSQGSLYTLLRQKGWITELGTGAENLNDIEGQFNITMELTTKGIKHIPQIESALYGYIDLLKEKGVEAWRYEEQKKLDELSFRYAVKESPFEYVSSLSSRILDYPPSELIRGGRILQQYDAALIHHYLNYLRADNALTVVLDKNLETNATEGNYQVPYALHRGVEKFPDPKIFADKLKLPESNPFVPKDPILLRSREKQVTPVILKKDKGLTLWHKLDNSFGTPRAIFTLRYRSPVAKDNAIHSVALKLFLRIIQERLAAASDAAFRAGIGYSLEPEAKGFTLQAYGYSETLPLFLDKLFTALSDHHFNTQRFEMQKAQLDRTLANKRRDYAYAQVLGALFRSIAKPSWSPKEQRDALHTLKQEDLRNWVDELFAKGEVTVLSLGNFDYKASLQLADRLKTSLFDKTMLQPVKGPDLSLPDPDENRKVEYPVIHPDSVLIEADTDLRTDIESSAYWQLLAQLIGQPFSAELRTRQQLGYVVISQFIDFYRHPMLLLVAQSSRVGADELLVRFGKFRETFFEKLKEIDPKSFEANKAGLIGTLLRKDETLLQRNERYWNDIVDDRLDFNFRQKVAARVKKIDKKSILEFYKKVMLEHPQRAYGFSQGTK